MKKSAKSSRGLFLSCIISQGFFIASTIVLLLIFCAIAFSLEDPESVTVPLSLCALYISSIISGVAAVKLSGDGIISGTVSGLVSAVLVFLISAFPLPDSSFAFPQSLLLTLLTVPASVIGSILGKKRSKKLKPHAKRKYR